MRYWFVVLSLLVVMPVLAQDKPAEKKDSPKKEVPPPAKKYQSVGTITGKLTKADTDERTIEVEHRVASSSRSGKNQKDELTLADDVKIRTLKLPPKVDSQNKPIPYTEAEKQKLKGDDRKLPGYTSELSALNAGQIVEVYLSTNKPPPGTKKDKDVAPEKPFVTMIVIAGDAPKKSDKEKSKAPDKEKKKP